MSRSRQDGGPIDPVCRTRRVRIHKSHLLHHLETVIETPAEELTVSGRDQNARSGKPVSRCDQCLQILIRLTYAMAHKSNSRRVPRDPTVALNHGSRPTRDSMGHLMLTIKAVHFSTKCVAGGCVLSDALRTPRDEMFALIGLPVMLDSISLAMKPALA